MGQPTNHPAVRLQHRKARSNRHSPTPAYVNCGRELAGPHPDERGRVPEAEPLERMHKNLNEARELVQINLAHSFQRQERHYNLRHRQWRPQIGAWVWKRDRPLSNKERGFNAKLAPRYVGPLEVRRVISPVIVDLRGKNHRWFKHVHVRDLKRTDPDDAPEEYDEEPAIAHCDLLSAPGSLPVTGETTSRPVHPPQDLAPDQSRAPRGGGIPTNTR